MPITEFPTRIVDINYSRDAADADWMTATAEADEQRWAISMRVAEGDADGSVTREKLGLAIMTGIQQAHARPCDTKGCERKASNHGTVRVNGDSKHLNVCRTCTNAIVATRPDGPMSVLLMPYFAFAKYDI
jgi:hypothetical protein